jgi:hypothetical protein
MAPEIVSICRHLFLRWCCFQSMPVSGKQKMSTRWCTGFGINIRSRRSSLGLRSGWDFADLVRVQDLWAEIVAPILRRLLSWSLDGWSLVDSGVVGGIGGDGGILLFVGCACRMVKEAKRIRMDRRFNLGLGDVWRLTTAPISFCQRWCMVGFEGLRFYSALFFCVRSGMRLVVILSSVYGSPPRLRFGGSVRLR